MTPLSKREREVMEWAAKGKSATVTAEILGISPATVNYHRKSAFAKADAPSLTTALVALVKADAIDV